MGQVLDDEEDAAVRSPPAASTLVPSYFRIGWGLDVMMFGRNSVSVADLCGRR